METKHTDKMHKGHRERMRARYMKNGIDAFDDYAILEMLLYNVYKVKDTYPVAHNLIDRFGTLSNVFSASAEELEKVDGVGEKAVEFITLTNEVFERIVFSDLMAKPFDNGINTHLLLTWRFRNTEPDTVGILFVSGQKNIDLIVWDRIGYTDEDINRTIRSYAEKYKNVKVIFSHRHPDNSVKPSVCDMVTTENLNNYCESVSAEFVNHYIVTSNQCFPIKLNNK